MADDGRCKKKRIQTLQGVKLRTYSSFSLPVQNFCYTYGMNIRKRNPLMQGNPLLS